MEVATILTILVLNILLPTADVYTDIILMVKLYKPPPSCKDDRSWSKVYILRGIYGELRGIYEECKKDHLTFCSRDENREHCVFSHPKMATILLMPFLLNYIVCFYTFFRLTTNRKRYTFIFPLLNLYPSTVKLILVEN